jgi:ribosomal protein S18 acetylase RimI-like enzyme
MIELRPAEFSEYATIAQLHAASWKKTYRGILSDRFLNDDVETVLLKKWQNRLSSPAINQEITLAIQDSLVVGFSCIYLDDNSSFGTLLDNLHVSASCQRSGVGKLLMKNCAEFILQGSNNHKMYLWVFEANQTARLVYERLGGENVEILKKQNEDGTEATACRYVWKDVTTLIFRNFA